MTVRGARRLLNKLKIKGVSSVSMEESRNWKGWGHSGTTVGCLGI